MSTKSDALLHAIRAIPPEHLKDFLLETGLFETPPPKLGRPPNTTESYVHMGTTQPAALKRLLVTLAKQNGGNLSGLVRDLIIDGLEKRGIIYEE